MGCVGGGREEKREREKVAEGGRLSRSVASMKNDPCESLRGSNERAGMPTTVFNLKQTFALCRMHARRVCMYMQPRICPRV